MTYLYFDKLDDFSQLHHLKDLSNRPKQLYIRGTWNPELFSHCSAVIGSRQMTQYGQQVIEKLVPQLVSEGKTIVSGFMYGVDQYAHRVCIEHGGKTIAVLGWGITLPLSKANESLVQQIENTGGMLISEWETQPATVWTFPLRNRIVAALAQEIYIIEAATKSGSLLTAQWGYKLKRYVWAVPGPITSRVSEGTNSLIAQGKAQAWLGPHNENAC